jgi:hypothetical protein
MVLESSASVIIMNYLELGEQIVGVGGVYGYLGVTGVDFLQILEVIGAQLVDDAGEQVLQLLGLASTADDIRVSGNRGLDLRVMVSVSE